MAKSPATNRACLGGLLKTKKGQATMSSEFTISQGAGQKLEFAFQRNGVGSDVLEWLSSGTNLELVRRLARGEAELISKTKTTTPEPEVEVDSIIRVDRSIRPSYPDWMKEVVHQELESVGPAEYDISAVEQWLHDGQKNGGRVAGTIIYGNINEPSVLSDHLGLRDLEEIQKKGIMFFRKHFMGKTVFGWKSIGRNRNGILYVPCLYELCGGVILIWFFIERNLSNQSPALRFTGI